MSANNVTFEMKGLDKLLKDLRTLEPRVQKKVVRKTLREGSKVIAQEAKATAPVESGALKKSIKVRAGKRKRNTISVVIQTSDSGCEGKQFYGAFQEFGTSKIQAKHYMENAFNAKEEEAKQKMLEILAKGIEQEAKK